MNPIYPLIKSLTSISIVFITVLLASCGGGGSSSGDDATLFTIGGSVTGLTGTVTLQNNGDDLITVNADGSFTFATELADGSAYLITVSTQPVEQACSVSNGSGMVGAANVTNIAVTCVTFTAPPVTAATAALNFDIKTFRFTWTDVSDATFYRLMENPDGISGFTQISGDIASGAETFDHTVSLYLRAGASYFLESCNSLGCTAGVTISITDTLVSAIGYFKSSNTATGDEFGIDVALSSDGNTLAVGAKNESGNTGAVYVFSKTSGSWVKQADITATSPASGDEFGTAVSLSADGNLLAVGAPQQSGTGRVYTFTRIGSVWTQQDSFRATVTGADLFGDAVSLSSDGSTLAVGAKAEVSTNPGVAAIDDDQGGVTLVGAAYIFTENAGAWTQQVYIKADNADGGDFFGASVSLNSDGNTLVVGATGEDSDTSGVGATAMNTADDDTGAVYVFTRSGVTWTQQEYIKASDSGAGDNFGSSVSLSDDGDTLAVGALIEASAATGVSAGDGGGNETDNSIPGAGAAYVFTRDALAEWSQQAYIKASNTDAGDLFGVSISLSADGDTLVVGAEKEQSNATGINGDELDNSLNALNGAGAAYVFTRNAGIWSQQAYVKANNSDNNDFFGTAIELSGDGETLAVGADTESSSATGVGGDETDNSVGGSGAVYLY